MRSAPILKAGVGRMVMAADPGNCPCSTANDAERTEFKFSFTSFAVLVSRTFTFNPEAGVGVRTSVGGIYYLRPLHDSIVEHREDHVETVGTETAYTNKMIITVEPKKESWTNEAHHSSNKVSRRHDVTRIRDDYSG